jgi:hypothetical protein
MNSEKRWLLWFAVAVMTITTLPYLYAYGLQDDHWRFSGHLIGVEDGNSYLANMLSGTTGEILFKTRYSIEPQSGILIFLPYIIIGKLASPPGIHEQLVFLYHAFRFGAGMLVILATYDFIAYFVREKWIRRVGTGLVTLGGGLGWVLLLWSGSINSPMPIDFYSPEAFGFLSIFAIPHLALARAFLLWGILSYLRADDQPRSFFRRGSLQTGCLWLLATVAQPLIGMLAGAIAGAHLITTAIWQTIYKIKGHNFDREIWMRYAERLVIAGLIAGPFYIYNVYSFLSDPFLNAWNAQSLIPSAPIWEYLFAYGLVLPFAGAGLLSIRNQRPWHTLLLVTWVLACVPLIYAPFSQQRRLIEGVWVALVTLTCLGLNWAWQRRSSIQRRFVQAAPVLTICLVPFVLLLAGGFSSARQLQPPLFTSTADIAAIDYLGKHASKGEIVLSAYPTGSVIPSRTSLLVYIGNTTQSVGFERLYQQVLGFFGRNLTNDERFAFLSSHQIRYVYWGNAERQIGDWNPITMDTLVLIYNYEGVMIFEIP